MRFALGHRAMAVLVGGLFVAGACFLATRLGSEFLPHLEEGNYWIRASMPMTLSLKDGEAAEAVDEGAGGEECAGQQADPSGAAFAEELVGEPEIDEEEGERKPAGSLKGDPADEEKEPLQEGP